MSMRGHVFGFLMMIPLAEVPVVLPSLVDMDDLNAANALETIGFTMGGVIGLPLAGLLIAGGGVLPRSTRLTNFLSQESLPETQANPGGSH